jgi:hypothetical protein
MERAQVFRVKLTIPAPVAVLVMALDTPATVAIMGIPKVVPTNPIASTRRIMNILTTKCRRRCRLTFTIHHKAGLDDGSLHPLAVAVTATRVV